MDELGEVPHTRVQAHFDVYQGCYPHLRLEGAFRDAVPRAAAGQGAPPDLKGKLLEA